VPGHDELVGLYRDVADPDYLAEEAGRRATAARLLDLIGPHVPSGRLLDVGCGHGLLLDEARRRGYDTVGLELSRSAASHARERLGLDVREVPLEDFETGEGFDVVFLVDVLEHLDDPLAGIDHCVRLLRPDGVLCVVTPDPSSPTARLAGVRWWGYLPAHTCLLPRKTLRELLGARGLIISTDVPLVRSFTARRWVEGLAERAGPLERGLRALAGRVPEHLSVSLPLGDEHVILAHRTAVRRSPEPLVRPRGGAARVHVILPAYNAARTVPAVAAELPAGAADAALLIDDASADDTTALALAHGFDVLRHPANRGYGGSQKTGYARALLDGADVVVMVHADNQYDPALVPAMVEPILAGEADMVIGSRLLRDRAVAGGMPRWKWLGNRLLTEMENRTFGLRLSEYHTGYRAFSAELLRSVPFLRNADAFVFDQQIFAQVVERGARIVEIPIPTRYFREASSVDFGTSVRYGLGTLAVLTRFLVDRRRRSWSLLRRPPPRCPGEQPHVVGRGPAARRPLARAARGLRRGHAARAAHPRRLRLRRARPRDRRHGLLLADPGPPPALGVPPAGLPVRPWAPSTASRASATARTTPAPMCAQLFGAAHRGAHVGMIGLLAAQLWGRPGGPWSPRRWAAVYVPLVTVGTAMMSEGLSRSSAWRRSSPPCSTAGRATAGAGRAGRAAVRAWRSCRGQRRGPAAAARPGGVGAPAALPGGARPARRPRRRGGPHRRAVDHPQRVVLDTFVPVTTQLGSALAGTYNDVSRRDGDNPWSWRSIDHVPAYEDLAARVSKIPEAELERRVRERAIDYIRERPVSVAEVGFWNTIRMLELAGFQRARETAATISIPPGPAIAGVLCFWLYALLAIAGACTARARATPLHVWLVPLLFAASVVFLTLETPRYRTPVEPFVVLLAALAVTVAVERRARRATAAPPTS
jgi:SAM-dependent methyltransferase